MDIPIEVHIAAEFAHASSYNVSVGGLAFQSSRELQRGSIVEVRIPFVQPAFQTRARVAWCNAREDGSELGIEFLDPEDTFRARMVEQVCSIESYQKKIYETEGRRLTTEQAAMEWIAKYAAQFPDLGPEAMQ